MQEVCIMLEISLLKCLKTVFFPFKDGFQEKESHVLNKKLPNWVRANETFSDQIKDQVKKVKDKNLYVRPNRGAQINVNDSYELIRDYEDGKITHAEALKKINKIHSDIERINDQDSFYENQVLVLNTHFLADANFTGEFKRYKKVGNEYKRFESNINREESDTVTQQSDEQPDTTDMPDLESEEPAAQRKNQQEKVLKILTPNQMLKIDYQFLYQLKAGNSSEKLKNEIRQLLYSFYRSKKLTKQLTLFKDEINFYEQRKQ